MAFVSVFETNKFDSVRRLLNSSNRFVLAFLVILCLAVYGNATRLLTQHATLSLPTVPIAAAAPSTADTPTPATNGGATPQTTAPAAAVAPVKQKAPIPACTPSTYSLPSILNIAANPAGLTEVIEPVQYYTVHGSNGTEVRSQIQQCAPRQNSSDSIAEFTAQTGYYLSWQYSYASQADGSCVVQNAKVGLHVGMVLPALQPSSGTSAGFQAQWNAFIASLTAHENGHVDLDKQYAREMLADLQNFPPSNCGTIQQSVNAIMQNSIVRLNIANERYDTATGHGATQGAVLPR